jgi:hypothetical protein
MNLGFEAEGRFSQYSMVFVVENLAIFRISVHQLSWIRIVHTYHVTILKPDLEWDKYTTSKTAK